MDPTDQPVEQFELQVYEWIKKREALFQKSENLFKSIPLDPMPVVENPCRGKHSLFIPNRYESACPFAAVFSHPSTVFGE